MKLYHKRCGDYQDKAHSNKCSKCYQGMVLIDPEKVMGVLVRKAGEYYPEGVHLVFAQGRWFAQHLTCADTPEEALAAAISAGG